MNNLANRRLCLILFALLISVPPVAGAEEGATGPTVIVFENGLWFDGSSFVAGSWTSVDGILHKGALDHAHMTIDLKGQWVVPPYGDAHVHFLEPDLIDAFSDHFLRRGVFYARDQTTSITMRRKMDERLNRSATIDFTSANQGFTGPGGHPLQILQQVQSLGMFPAGWTPEDFNGEAIFVVDSDADIASAWPKFLAGKPDFVKIYLLHSEHHGERRGDEAFLYRRGLDPKLVAPIVERAHAAGLDVSAHVYSRADFRAAIKGGVDFIAHCPGIDHEPGMSEDLSRITVEDAELAARLGVVVATTLSDTVGAPSPITDEARAFVSRVIEPNVAKLVAAGVPLVVGSDRFRMVADVEAEALHALGLFNALTLLKMWAEETPRSIFPGRRIGLLAAGFEASFLVLEGNPLEDFANTQRIALRVKQGQLLFPPEPEFPALGR